MPDTFSLYPQPQPNTQPNLLADPVRGIAALQGLTTLQKQQMELQGQRAFGQLYKDHVNPDGSVDTDGLVRAAAKDPAASVVLHEYMPTALQMRGQQISNAQNWLALHGSADQATRDFIGSLPHDATPEQINNAVTTWSRFRPDIPGYIKAGVAQLAQKNGVPFVRNLAMGPAAISAATQGPPTEGGAPQRTTVEEANRAGGTFPTAPPMGATESSNVMQADLAHSRTFPQEIFPWTQALEKMQAMQAQGETFGPGSKGRQQLQSFVYALSPTIARWTGVDPEKISNYSEVEKYLTQGLQGRAANFGAHTDMQLATTASGSPNVHITDLAGVPLVKATIAMRRMEQAQILENSKFGGPQYTSEAGKWAVRQDPRAYMIDMLPPEQVKQLQATLKGPERARFNASLRAAIRSGVVTPPGAAPATPAPIQE